MSYLSSSSEEEDNTSDKYTVEAKGSYFGENPDSSDRAKGNGNSKAKQGSPEAEEEDDYGDEFESDMEGKTELPPVVAKPATQIPTSAAAAAEEEAIKQSGVNEYVPIIQVNNKVEAEKQLPEAEVETKRGNYANILTTQKTLTTLSKERAKESTKKKKGGSKRSKRPGSAPDAKKSSSDAPSRGNSNSSRPTTTKMAPSFQSITGESLVANNPLDANGRRRGMGRSISLHFLREASRLKREQEKQLLLEIRMEQEKLDERVVAQMVEATRWAHTLKKQVKFTPVFETGTSNKRGELHCEVINQTTGKRKKLSTTLFLREHQTLKEKYEKYMKQLEKKKNQNEDASQMNHRSTKNGNKPIEIELRKLLDETTQVTMELQTQLDELRFRGWNSHLFWDD